MNNAHTKLEKISVFISLFIMIALDLGLLWFAESKIERIIFCIGIILMIIYVLLSKAQYLIYFLIVGMLFTVYYTVSNLMPILYYSNSNLDALTAYSVWSNPQNEYCDPYSADAMMYTILSNKTCRINSDGYYYDYAKALFKEVIADDSIPLMLNHENYMESEEFEKIGVSLARNHILLFADASIRFDNVTYVFVNPVNLEKSVGAVFMNDDMGNIYILAESEWKNE